MTPGRQGWPEPHALSVNMILIAMFLGATEGTIVGALHSGLVGGVFGIGLGGMGGLLFYVYAWLARLTVKQVALSLLAGLAVEALGAYAISVSAELQLPLVTRILALIEAFLCAGFFISIAYLNRQGPKK